MPPDQAPPRPGLHAHLALLGYALSSLVRRRARSIAVVIGLASSVALLSSVVFLTDALRAEASRAQRAAPDLVLQRMVGGRPSLVPEPWVSLVQGTPGVAKVRARVWGYVFFPALSGNVTVVGASGGALPSTTLEQGRFLLPGERGACVLGSGLAKALGLRAGDKLRFPAPDDHGPLLTVQGVLASSVSLFASDVALLDDGEARAVLGVPDGQATDVAIDLTNPDESAALSRRLAEQLPAARVVERRLLERVQSLSFGRRSGFVLGASIPALLSLLLLAYDRTSGIGEAERREIAVQKASGWSSADVLLAKLYESLLLSVVGASIGLVLGFAWVFWLEAPGLGTVLAGWSALYPSLSLAPEVTLGQLLGMLSMVSGPYVALSVVPAWRASMLDPMEALRGS